MKRQAEFNRQLLDMGTTLTAAAIFDDKIMIYNIGDSRTYAYNGLLHQVTEDQNLRNYYIDKHGYSEDEASQIVGAAALTSALGPTKNTQIKPYEVPRTDEMRFVILTSDGIHDYIAPPVMDQVFAHDSSISEKGEQLITKAMRGKSSDNLTCVIVDLRSAH